MKSGTLWVFGDSYTTPDLAVDTKDSFWALSAAFLKRKSICNCSRPGNSWDSVMQLLIGMQDCYDWNKDYFIIGVPPLERITVFDDYRDTPYVGKTIDTDTWHHDEFNIQSHHGLVCLQNYGDDRELIVLSDRSWTETKVLREIFLITKWLDSIQAKYLLVNLSKPFDVANIWGPSESVLPYVADHARCMIFDHTYHSINADVIRAVDYDEYGEYGHHGAAGNHRFFELCIKPRIAKLDLV